MSVTRRFRVVLSLALVTLVCLVAAGVLRSISLSVNGKASSKAPLIRDGETYIPVSALRAGGAQVTRTGDHISVSFPTNAAGADAGSIEGKVGEWLENGIWRLKVQRVELIEGACAVTIELGNVSTVTTYPAITGMTGVELYEEKGSRLPLSAASADAWSELTAYDYAPGSTVVRTLKFGVKAGITPATLILNISPDADKRSIMSGKGLKYKGSPSFRVHLK